MAIDYQQILNDMNRPVRRQGGGWKKLVLLATLCLVLGGGAYSAWHFGYISTAVQMGQDIAGRYFGSRAAANKNGTGGVQLNVTVANLSAQPETTSVRPASPAPAPSGPINIAAELGAAQPAAPVQSVQPQTVAQAPARSTPPASQQSQAVDAVPAVLSDARAQMKVIDQMLASNPAEALRRVEELMQTSLSPADRADAGYRLGYAARMVRDEAKAESAWREAAEKYPDQIGGRFSALALADTWYARYAAERPQVSFWDDIQLLYSRVIGFDDAPFLPAEVRNRIKANLTNLNESLFFGSAPTKLARYHKVESGELLGSIANRYRVDYESIARINGINPNRIRVGMDLKLVVGEVAIIVRKNTADPDKTPTVSWYLDGRWAREYPACIGEGLKTPAGTYELISKEKDPSWTNPANGQLLPHDHPENILGSRWMAMKGMNTQGLGIHGTTVDDSIPGYSSAGCVRLLDRDVEELFSFARIGSKVTIYE